MGKQFDDLCMNVRHVTKRYLFAGFHALTIRFRSYRLPRAIPPSFIVRTGGPSRPSRARITLCSVQRWKRTWWYQKEYNKSIPVLSNVNSVKNVSIVVSNCLSCAPYVYRV